MTYAPSRPVGKIRVKTGHFINFYIGRVVRVGIAVGSPLVLGLTQKHVEFPHDENSCGLIL
jgi:hypothetical protein